MKGAFVAACLVLLAGCSDAPTGGEDPDVFDGIDTTTATGKGLIRGVVIDGAIQPIAEATVSIKVGGLEATTNADGIFVFKDLDPGTYFLGVAAVGYAPVQASTVVVADVDKPQILKIQLQRMVGLDPRVAYTFFEGYVGCSVQVANLVQDNICGTAGGIDPDQRAPLQFGQDERPDWLQTELQWEMTQIIGQRLGIIQYMAGEGGGRIGNIWGESPLTCRVGPDAPCDNGDGTGGGGTGLNATTWTDRVDVRVFANCFETCVPGTALGAGLVLQQDYQVYGSLFYNMEPMAEWTFIADGEHPVGQ